MKIILVEDDPENAAYWRDTLADDSREVTHALAATYGSPHEAFLSSINPDVVIYDLGCVGVLGQSMSGYTSPLRSLISKWPCSTFILVSFLGSLAKDAIEDLKEDFDEAHLLNGCGCSGDVYDATIAHLDQLHAAHG